MYDIRGQRKGEDYNNTTMFSASLLLFSILVGAVPRTAAAAANANGGPIGLELPPLPYAYDALEPFISRRTLEIHHDKHHAKYVNTMNEMIQGTAFEKESSLQDIVKKSYQEKNQGLFNNAAQSWNHAFYWNCMKPNGGGVPPQDSTLYKLITSSFGSFEKFKTEFATAGNTAFGSGWAWLVYCNSSSTTTQPKTLQVLKTIGADNPMTNDGGNDTLTMTPILTMDVWEHAYYLDYQNMRNTYVDTFLDKLVNWDFVAKNLDRAMKMTETEQQQQQGRVGSMEL
jgi:superoxide dismutase, Fe-Mn family